MIIEYTVCVCFKMYFPNYKQLLILIVSLVKIFHYNLLRFVYPLD